MDSIRKGLTRREFLAVAGAGFTILAVPSLAEDQGGMQKMSQVYLPAGNQPYRPYTLSPYDRGFLIEDTWPTIYFGEEVADEIRRKVKELSWARFAFGMMKTEAQVVMKSPPQLPLEQAGWRHDFYSRATAEHLLYDPGCCDRFLDPSTGKYEYDGDQRKAWTLLTHERTFRLMRSLGILYRVAGDESYAAWVAEGMRGAAAYFTHNEFKNKGALYHQPLYDAAVLSMLAYAYGLTRKSPAYSADDHRRIREQIFEEMMPSQLDFLKAHPTHNMSCYVSAALACCGRLFQRDDWTRAGVGENSGLKAQLINGLKTGKDGRVDGFWYEGTMFYHFYSLCPLVTLWETDGELGGKLSKDPGLRRRFTEMFAAPVALVDQKLRLPVLGDLGAPRVMNLAAYRHLYEYAAGKLDYDRFAPVLASIYKTAGAKRLDLTALAFGPDHLPEPDWVPKGHTLLSVAETGVFRSEGPESLSVMFRCGHFAGGHDHPDRLGITINAFGKVVSPDPGTSGYSLHGKVHNYYRTTLAHNTLFADESNQSGDATWEWKPNAARGEITGKDGICYRRTLFFVSPYVVLLDEYESKSEHRFGWVYHAYGELSPINGLVGPEKAGQVSLPPLPAGKEYDMFTSRASGWSEGETSAVWKVDGDLYLQVRLASDGPFEVTYGRTPGQPLPDDMGCLLLRLPGRVRRVAWVIEPYQKEGLVEGVSLEGESVVVRLKDGERREYRWG